ncbi:MAG: putative tail tape measure protein [Prokaryotic dsDNA virus sp.]|nr:MAG: putative tail tape measure protein [Prokaryotic dsDNA virus sp.]|tara:strand:+ start:5634 stop:7826 length:2193 start_codon:yes stop_codon:yes gene_type:complete
MAENLGSIRYDVEVNTASTLKADTVVGKTTDSMVNNFKKVDNATKTLNTQVTKASAGVKRAMNANLGQAGIQVQQFVGQLQGGQSAMVALAQQSADLGIVLGAPLIGVFVSLAAVLAGTLAPAIFGSVSNIEKLQKAIENTKAVMTVGASGVAEYTEEIKRLNTASESLAKIKIALAMTENAEALKASKKEASALRAELIDFQEDATDAAKRLTGLTSSTNDILSLTGAMNDFNAATSDDKKLKALDTAEKALLNMRKNGAFPTKELAEYAAEFFTFSDATRQAIANNKALSVSMDDMASSTKDAESQFKSIKDALRSQIIELNSGEEAALRYSLLLDGLNSDQIDQIITLTRKKKALEDEAEAVKLAQKANEDYKESIKSVNDELDSFFDKESSDSTKKDEQRKATLTTQVQSVGLTPLEQIQARYQAEKALLEQAEAEKIEIVGTYAERYKQIEAEKQEAIQGLQSNTNEFMENAFGNLDTQIAGTLGSIALGAQDGEEAFRSLANTILTQVVGALIQEQVTSALVSAGFIAQKGAETAAVVGGIGAQAAAATAATATTTAATVASGVAITAAMAPAAAATSIATAGAAPAAASGITLSTIGLIIGGLVGATALAGGREFGGPVSAGSMYRVGEKGKPEFYKDNLGNLSMIPGENGEVIPANKMGGNSGGMTVQVNNYTPYQVFVTQDQATNIAKVEIGNEASKLQKGRGNMYNAMKSGGNYKNDAKR